MAEQGATTMGGSSMRAWLRSHAYGLLSSLGRFAGQPFNHALTLGVLALALALPTLGHLSLKNLRHLSGALSQPGDVSLFLSSEMDGVAAQALQDQVAVIAGVASVSMKSPEQALTEFRELTSFTDALNVLDANPLPYVLVVTMATEAIKGERAPGLVAELRALPGVEIVQFDQEWLLRLRALMALAERGVWVIGALLALTVLLVIGNTIRLEIASRADEIQIVRLIGASNAFVRRPFLYSGFWFGVFGALLAVALVALAVHFLRTPVTQLANSYGSAFSLQGLTLQEMVIVVLIGTGLGWLGAGIASTSHLLGAEAPK